MKKKFFFSIIIPTANRASDLDETLMNLKKSKYKNFEVILINNNSSDDTKKIIKKYSFVKAIHNSLNKNCIEARNQGILASKGKVILCLDDDSYPHMYALEYAHRIFSKFKNVGILACGIKNYYTSKSEKLFHKKKLSPNYAQTWSGCGGFFLKELFDKYGPWDEDPPRMGYYELLTNLWSLKDNKKILCEKNVFVYHKVSQKGDGYSFRFSNLTLVDEIYANYYFIIKYFNFKDVMQKIIKINNIISLSVFEKKNFIFLLAFLKILVKLPEIFTSRKPFTKEITDKIRLANCFQGK